MGHLHTGHCRTSKYILTFQVFLRVCLTVSDNTVIETTFRICYLQTFYYAFLKVRINFNLPLIPDY